MRKDQAATNGINGEHVMIQRIVGRATTLVLAAVACAGPATRSSPIAPVEPRAAADLPNLYEAQRQVEGYIDSGRYDRDLAAVVASARDWLEQRSRTATKPAIVLDIDETSLSNWPAYRLNGWGRVVNGGCDLEQSPCGLRAWQALGRSQALAPTRELAKRAHELGVAVFFISGRPPTLREATERNLRDQGYQWNGVVLLPQGVPTSRARWTSRRRPVGTSRNRDTPSC